MVETIITVILVAIAFAAGVTTTEHFYIKAQAEQKAALEKQYLRLISCSDADDPCRPYMYTKPVQPISQQFMDQLKQTGKAMTKFKKSELK